MICLFCFLDWCLIQFTLPDGVLHLFKIKIEKNVKLKEEQCHPEGPPCPERRIFDEACQHAKAMEVTVFRAAGRLNLLFPKRGAERNTATDRTNILQ